MKTVHGAKKFEKIVGVTSLDLLCISDRDYFLEILSRRGPPAGSDPSELRRYRVTESIA